MKRSPRTRRQGGETPVERAVVNHTMDGVHGDWVLSLECGHIKRVTPYNAPRHFYTTWCTSCGRDMAAGSAGTTQAEYIARCWQD